MKKNPATKKEEIKNISPKVDLENYIKKGGQLQPVQSMNDRMPHDAGLNSILYEAQYAQCYDHAVEKYGTLELSKLVNIKDALLDKPTDDEVSDEAELAYLSDRIAELEFVMAEAFDNDGDLSCNMADMRSRFGHDFGVEG